MAKEPDDNPLEEAPQADEAAAGAGRSQLIVRIGLMAAVLGIGSAGGYVMGGLFHGSPAPADANQLPPDLEQLIENDGAPPTIAEEDFKYLDFDPITVNVNVPRQDRHMQAEIVLAIRSKDEGPAAGKISAKKQELLNWLTTYLRGLTLDDVRGTKNLNRIRREIQEAFNKQLWPRSRPLIDHVLFKKFIVQ